MSRFDDLVATVETYQALAEENYNRIRRLAEDVRLGLCHYLDAGDGNCVHLVPPGGPFEARSYGDQAFSIPPRGFRPLGPVSFGLAVRISRKSDWLRLTLHCRKTGDTFVVQIEEGSEYEFHLPILEADAGPFYDHLYDHILGWFTDNIERYQEGAYGARAIGFDFSRPESGKEIEFSMQSMDY
ncbi:hypothetical protein [Hyphomonas sp.]|uniref:hypothetical protein n=1 Tax=Hyphomonas sp. TaxID=87 RepID=UPI00391DCA33